MNSPRKASKRDYTFLRVGDVTINSQNQQNNGDFDKHQVIQQLAKVEELIAKSDNKNQKEFNTLKGQIKDLYEKLESVEDKVDTQTEQNQQAIKITSKALATVLNESMKFDKRIGCIERKGSIFICISARLDINLMSSKTPVEREREKVVIDLKTCFREQTQMFETLEKQVSDEVKRQLQDLKEIYLRSLTSL